MTLHAITVDALLAAAPPIVQATNLSRRFGATQALSGVDLEIQAGEVRALAGRNGAGKSTLVSLLTGLVAPDAGDIRFHGTPAPSLGKPDQWQTRVACVYQHPRIVPTLSCAENLFLGANMRERKLISWPRMRREARALLEHWNLDLDVDAPAGQLTIGQRQLLEIARALTQGSRFVILDEPTAKLEGGEVDRLFAQIRTLQARQVAVLFISHHLDEIYEICQTVTVLRDGHKVLDQAVGGLSQSDLVAAMVGPSYEARCESRSASGSGSNPVSAPIVLDVRDLTRRGDFEDVSFQIHAGECLGLAGLTGSGKQALGEALAGLKPFTSGTIHLEGARLSGADIPGHYRAGIGFVPQDRHREGLVLGLSVAENATMTVSGELGPLGIILPRAQSGLAQQLIEELDIKTADSTQPVAALSGGNQQKVVFARALARDPTALILINPTSGVDVASKAALFATIRRAAEQGKAILVVSDELEELEICDRVLVMRSHRLTHEFHPPFPSHDLVAAMEGVNP